jgi:hypothetical protein
MPPYAHRSTSKSQRPAWASYIALTPPGQDQAQCMPVPELIHEQHAYTADCQTRKVRLERGAWRLTLHQHRPPAAAAADAPAAARRARLPPPSVAAPCARRRRDSEKRPPAPPPSAASHATAPRQTGDAVLEHFMNPHPIKQRPRDRWPASLRVGRVGWRAVRAFHTQRCASKPLLQLSE